jgi:hypothetical protein
MANYNLGSGFIDTQDNQKHFSDKFVGSDPGPYVGIVKNTIDPLKMGRLGVLIPAISNVPATSKDSGKVIWCQYLSPFYGVKPFSSVSKSDPYSHTTSQSSYGMWAVPPDIETHVLVIFAEGDKKQSHAFWIGCIQEPLSNHMVPGMGASKKSRLGVETTGDISTQGKEDLYGTDFLPIGEKNKNEYFAGEGIDSLDKWNYPINVDLADQLRTQGLVQDTIRGTTSSSARRESPSQVFGISTPGRIKANSRTPNIGLEGMPVAVDRTIGHSFVMDDGDVNNQNQLTRLRTASGHQLLMHDTDGVVYIANGSGKSWIEMSSDGKVQIYAQDGFNFRSDGNFDLHSGGDINFHAKHSIKFNAEHNLNLSAGAYLNLMGELGIEKSSQTGAVRTYAKGGISSFTSGEQAHGAKGRIDLAGSQVHFNSTDASSGWGPEYLKPDHVFVGIVTDDSQNDVNITVGPHNLLEANSKETKTTVPNLVTHEPFTRAPSAITENVSQWEDKEKWEKLMKTEGTLEYMAQKNRESDIEYITQLQFLADAKKYVADKGNINLKNINLSKAKELSDRFTEKYNEIYKVKSVIKNLSKDNIKQILTRKVVAGKITSVVSNLKGIALGRTSANNLPPSMRGTMRGQLMQIGSAIKGHVSTAFKAISSIFS